MIHRMYSVYDGSVGVFFPPFYARAKGEAIRSFTELSNDPKTSVGKYPDQFTLFELGEFDDESGLIRSHASPLSMGLAVEFVKRA